jgi:23S rRNA pseudouridine1911/1915/1917 synthase
MARAIIARLSGVNAGFEYSEQIGPEDAGATALAYLVRRHRHSSEAVWAQRIRAGEVLVAGALPTIGDVLLAGQRLVWRRPPWQEPEVPLTFAILHRDEHVLAVAKPRGLPSVPNGGFLTHTLLHRVRQLFPEATPMHRLGRGTSGLLLFARTPEARRRIAAEWRAGAVDKVYRALVRGNPQHAAFSIGTPIGLVPHPRLGWVHAASSAEGAKPALTHVRVLTRRDDSAVIEARIPTGRPHQIRIHLAAAGHVQRVAHQGMTGGVPAPEPGLPGDLGYWLHAQFLSLTHPATGERLALSCCPPPILRD